MRRTGKAGIALALTAALIIGGVQNPSQIRAGESDVTTFSIDATNLEGSNVFEGWGTSLCWFGNRIGGSEKTSEEAAKLLCSEEGLGLDIIRFNIGGGDNPSHNHITRTDSKMPGYWGSYDEETDTFDYDFTKDANQRNVLNKMLEQNKDLTLEAFSNSAPYFMTNSGCTSGVESGAENNLKEDKYDDFAEYLATVIKYYKENYGIHFSSVSAMNEASSGWSIESYGNKQEGCTFTRGEAQSKMLVAMDEALKKNNLEDVILAGTDETSPANAIKGLEEMSEEALAVLDRIDVHTYQTAKQIELNQKAEELSKNLWMSEVDGGDVNGSDAGEMGAALALAVRIGENMALLNPSAWVMWQAIGSYCSTQPYEGNQDPDSLDQSEMDTNGFWGVAYADMDQEKVVLTKKYYGYGQYTKYIHKGDIILDHTSRNLTAYDKEKNELKIVAVNTTKSTQKMKYDIAGLSWNNPAVEVVRTSGDMATGENWKKLDYIAAGNDGFQAELLPNSITTFIVKEAPEDAFRTPEPQNTVTPTVSQATATPPAVTAGETKTSKVGKVSQVKAAKITKNAVTISWKKQSNAKYKVAYSANKKKLAKIKDGKGKVVVGTKVVSANKNKITLKKLKKNTVYYIKVCAYQTVDGKKVYGKYSSVKKVKTKKK